MAERFNEILSRLRHEKGVSQREAAAAFGISQALLSHYENGVREPGLAFLAMACDYYGVSADYILGMSAIKERLSFDENEKNTVGEFLSVAVQIAKASIAMSEETREMLSSYISAMVYSLASERDDALISSLILLRRSSLSGELKGLGFKLPEEMKDRVEKELDTLDTLNRRKK